MAEKLQAVRGMSDLLPEDSARWQRVEAALRETARVYGYREIRTPIVEQAELFTQSIGDQTDIVEKEMYAFTDQGGARLALRPEATASAVRACNQHGLLHGKRQRLWYLGAMFRRERPQKGRYRQFHQFGIEAFGWPGPDIDAEVIGVSASIWAQLGVTGLRLQINTLGSPQISADYRHALRAYFTEHREHLDADSLRRLDTNPLRILDSKVPATREVAAGAPQILAYLDAEARAHFDGLGESLTRAGIPFEVNPHLVRGLDYYTSTVFEWVSDDLGAQNAVCAGGRYDGLVEKRGGKATPAVGFAMGLERLVDLVAVNTDVDIATDCGGSDIYVASAAEPAQTPTQALPEAVAISEALRRAGLAVTTHCGGGRLKNQLRQADLSGARAAVITGLDVAGRVQVKRLRGDGGDGSDGGDGQKINEINADALVEWCRNNL